MMRGENLLSHEMCERMSYKFITKNQHSGNIVRVIVSQFGIINPDETVSTGWDFVIFGHGEYIESVPFVSADAALAGAIDYVGVTP